MERSKEAQRVADPLRIWCQYLQTVVYRRVVPLLVEDIIVRSSSGRGVDKRSVHRWRLGRRVAGCWGKQGGAKADSCRLLLPHVRVVGISLLKGQHVEKLAMLSRRFITLSPR